MNGWIEIDMGEIDKSHGWNGIEQPSTFGLREGGI